MNSLDQLISQYCPAGVPMVRLGEVCEILDSKRKPISKSKRNKGQYPYYGANGIQDYVDNYLFDGDYLLIGEDGSVITPSGKPILNWATNKFWVNNHAHIIEGLDGTSNLRYIYHALHLADITDLVHGVPPKLNQENLRSISIPLPPLPVQEEIVRILDAMSDLVTNLDAEISARQKQYEHAREKLLSFGEEVEYSSIANLSSLVTKQTGFDYSNRIKSALLKSPSEGSIPYMQTKFFTGKSFDYNTDYYVPSYIANEYPKITLDEKCILFSIVGASIGNIGLFPSERKCFLGGAICVVKIKRGYNIDFMYYYLCSNEGQKQIAAKIKGAGQDTITVDNIRKFSIPLPSLSVQQSIVERLDKMESLIQNLQAERALRQKQYEYYREKLLTFEKNK